MPQSRGRRWPSRPSLQQATMGASVVVTVGLLAGWGPAFAVSCVSATVWSVSQRRHAVRVERRRCDAQLAQVLEAMARHVTVGHSLGQALEGAASAVTEPARGRLRQAVDDMRLGAPADLAFTRVASGIGTEAWRVAAVVLATHALVGGRLVATLRGLASVARDRRSLDGEIRALVAQGRLSGILVGVLPLVFSIGVGGPDPGAAGRGGIPAWIVPATRAAGWVLAIGGVLVILWLTSPDRVGGVTRTRDRVRGEPAHRLMAVLGRVVPEPFGGRSRARAILREPRGGVGGSRLDASAGQRATASLLTLSAAVLLAPDQRGLAIGAILAAAAWYAVEWWWRVPRSRDREAVEDVLPGVCDVLALRLRAGQSLVTAIRAAAVVDDGVLGGRLRTASSALSVGVDFPSAVAAVGEGADSDDLDELVATLLEAHRRGGDVGRVLGDLAADMRRRRRYRIQERARRLPVLLLLPLTTLVLPAFVLLTIVPMLADALAGAVW